MANYIRRGGGKKKNQLRQKEKALRGDIRRQAARAKIESSAERVRTAHLGVIKALINECQLNQGETEQNSRADSDRLQDAKEYWETISKDEIIEMYSQESADDAFVDRKRYWDLRRR